MCPICSRVLSIVLWLKSSNAALICWSIIIDWLVFSRFSSILAFFSANFCRHYIIISDWSFVVVVVYLLFILGQNSIESIVYGGDNSSIIVYQMITFRLQKLRNFFYLSMKLVGFVGWAWNIFQDYWNISVFIQTNQIDELLHDRLSLSVDDNRF